MKTDAEIKAIADEIYDTLKNYGLTIREACGVLGAVTVRISEKKPVPVAATPTNQKCFIKPTLEEVAAYCIERRNGVDPQSFIDHYISNGWRVGKVPMKDWRAAVRTWEKRELRVDGGNPKKPSSQPKSNNSKFEAHHLIEDRERRAVEEMSRYREALTAH